MLIYKYSTTFLVANYIDWITPHLNSDLTEVKSDNSVEDFSDDVSEDDKVDEATAEPVKYNPKQVKRFCKLPADNKNGDWADYTEINGSIKGKEKGDKILRKLVTCLIQMQKVKVWLKHIKFNYVVETYQKSTRRRERARTESLQSNTGKNDLPKS